VIEAEEKAKRERLEAEKAERFVSEVAALEEKERLEAEEAEELRLVAKNKTRIA